MDIHLRTTIQFEYSFIEAAAIRIGEDVLVVGSWGDYLLNGVAGAELPNHLAGFTVTYEKFTDKVDKFKIYLDDNTIIELKTYQSMVAVNMPRSAALEGSVGLLGSYPKGEKLGRDGVTIFEDMDHFGQEWQVRDTETMLFEAARLPQYPQQCRLPKPNAQSTTTRQLRQPSA